MTSVSPLSNIYKKGLYGDYENKNESNLIKISEAKNLLIVQIVKYKNSSLQKKDIIIDGLNFINEPNNVNYNNESRILWCGPNNWLLVSKKNDLLEEIEKFFDQSEFAVTDLSQSRAVIEIEGENSIEILKKGCPFNFNEFKKNNCVNSIFNGITVTIDMIDEKPNKIRLLVLRSFGESFYHSITDSCLEHGYKAL